MDISIIAAASTNGVIGLHGQLPWHLPNDMAYFKRTTMGYPVIMGRKSYESLPNSYRPLKGRPNIVLTRDLSLSIAGVEVAHSLEEALRYAQKYAAKEVFIIGGGEVYAQSMHLAHKLYITHVAVHIPKGVRFPDWNPQCWKMEEASTSHPKDKHHAYPFEHRIYVRTRANAH